MASRAGLATRSLLGLALAIVVIASPDGLGAVEMGGVGGSAWIDADLDGLRDRREEGVPDVTVVLYRVEDGARVVPEVATTLTGDDGTYAFGPLPPGDHQLEFRPVGGLVPTYQDAGRDERIDSDADQFTGVSDVFHVGSDAAATVDVGLVRTSRVNTISGIVWEDWDGDATQQVMDERALGGVRVSLLEQRRARKPGGGGRGDRKRFRSRQTVSSDPRHGYRFFVRPGDRRYRIEVGSIDGYERAGRNAARDDLTDSDVSRGSGRSPWRRARRDRVVDAGLVPLSTIGDRIWLDADGDGLQTDGEEGVSGAEVSLWRSADESSTLALVDTMRTVEGRYAFEPVRPGRYLLDITPLRDTTWTERHVGTDPYADSDMSMSPSGFLVPDDLIPSDVLARRRQELGWDRALPDPSDGPESPEDEGVVIGTPPGRATQAAQVDVAASLEPWLDGGLIPSDWPDAHVAAAGPSECDSGTPVLDRKVEMRGVTTIPAPDGGHLIVVEMRRGLEKRDFSFTLLVTIRTAGGPRIVIWERHDGEWRVGELDAETGQLARVNGDGVRIRHSRDRGVLTFRLTPDGPWNGADLGFVQSFHAPRPRNTVRCHAVGPFELSRPADAPPATAGPDDDRGSVL